MRTISKRFTLTHVFALSKHRHSFPRDSSFFLYRFVQLRIDSESILGDREVHGEAPRCSGVSDWSLVVIFPWSSLGRSYRRQAAYAVNPSSGQVINWSHHFENHLYFSFLPNSTTIALQVTQINLIFVWLLRFLNKISNEKISFYTVFFVDLRLFDMCNGPMILICLPRSLDLFRFFNTIRERTLFFDYWSIALISVSKRCSKWRYDRSEREFRLSNYNAIAPFRNSNGISFEWRIVHRISMVPLEFFCHKSIKIFVPPPIGIFDFNKCRDGILFNWAIPI